MDLRQLRSFLAVVDHGSFSAAADSLFTVQSNVSAHVGRLETEVGTTLLDRRTRELTPSGQVVERRARQILLQLDAIGDDLAALENRIIGNVACGTTPSIGLRIIPQALAEATQELPEVAIRVAEAHSGTLVQMLLAGDLDLAVTTSTSSGSDLRSTPLFTEDIVAVLADTHLFSVKHSLSMTDVSQTKLLLPSSDNPLYGHIERAFNDADLRMNAGYEIGSSNLVQAMAAANVGVALVPATAAEVVTAGTVIRSIDHMPPRRVALAARSAGTHNQAIAAVEQLLIKTAKLAAASMPGCEAVD